MSRHDHYWRTPILIIQIYVNFGFLTFHDISCRATPVADFGFLPQNFRRWWEPTNDWQLFTLTGGGDTKTSLQRTLQEPPCEAFIFNLYFQFRERISDVLHPDHDDLDLLKWLQGMTSIFTKKKYSATFLMSCCSYINQIKDNKVCHWLHAV